MFDFIMNVSTNYNNTNLQCLNYKTPLEMLNEYLNKGSDVNKDNERRRTRHLTKKDKKNKAEIINKTKRRW